MKPLTIGQVARRAGVGVETVRFYEKCCPLDEQQQDDGQSFIRPVTGEELPREKCCPLNDGK